MQLLEIAKPEHLMTCLDISPILVAASISTRLANIDVTPTWQDDNDRRAKLTLQVLLIATLCVPGEVTTLFSYKVDELDVRWSYTNPTITASMAYPSEGEFSPPPLGGGENSRTRILLWLNNFPACKLPKSFSLA
jgi:hypothetical protein